MKGKKRRDWNWVKGELDWAWNGGRRLWIIAGMVTGAVPGGALGTYGFFNLKAGAVDIAIFFFISGFTLFAAVTGVNWWMDREQTRGIYEVRPKQREGGRNEPR